MKEFVEKHRGELVIEGVDVVRLEDFASDSEDNYYVVVGNAGRYWISCVTELFPLKGVLPDDQYERLEYLFNLNYNDWVESNNSKSKMREWEHKWNQR